MARERPAARRDEHDVSAREEQGLDPVHAGPADGRRPWNEVDLQQRRQPVTLRHHPDRDRTFHRRLRDRDTVSSAGIREFHWKKTPTGHPDTEGGLYLSAEDLAKIGLLYLRDGQWEGKHILPPGWVRAATTRHVTGLPGRWDYGYQWWLTTRGGAEVWAGRGFGGQMLIVIPSRDIVGVIQSWNVFGGKASPIFEPFVAALQAAAAAESTVRRKRRSRRSLVDSRSPQSSVLEGKAPVTPINDCRLCTGDCRLALPTAD